VLITVSTFAKNHDLAITAVNRACKAGKIVCEIGESQRGKTEYFNLDDAHPKTLAYIAGVDRGRQASIRVSTRKTSKKNVNVTELLAVKNKPVEVDSNDNPASLAELPEKYMIANVRLKEQAAEEKALKNAVRRGELLEREKVYTVFLHLDKLHSNLERLADSVLADISKLIVDAGRLKPEHRAKWKDSVFAQIDDARNWIVDEIKRIEEEQKG
jgi:hypothetical protein